MGKKIIVAKYILILNIILFIISILMVTYRVLTINYKFVTILRFDGLICLSITLLLPILIPYIYIKKKNKTYSKVIEEKTNIIPILLTILVCVIFTIYGLVHYFIQSLFLVSIFGSRTTNIENYLKLDEELENIYKYGDFPKIDDYDYSNIKYSYEFTKFLGIEDCYILSLEIILPDDEYEYEMNRIANLENSRMYYDSKTERKFYSGGCSIIFYKSSNKITYEYSLGY